MQQAGGGSLGELRLVIVQYRPQKATEVIDRDNRQLSIQKIEEE